MGDTVTQVVDIIVDVVKIDDEAVIAVHHQHRRDIHVARQTDLERPHVIIKNMDACIHIILGHGGHHQAAEQQRNDLPLVHN